MKKKIKISLILSLAIIFGCFSNVFAARQINSKLKKNIKTNMSRKLLDSAPTTNYAPKKDYSTNLVAKWIFDDTNSDYVSGDTVKDLSGHGNNLTCNKIIFKNDCDLGRCAYFNGKDAYMSASSPIITSGKKSIIVTFKSDYTSITTYGDMLINRDSSSSMFFLKLSNDGIITGEESSLNEPSKHFCVDSNGIKINNNKNIVLFTQSDDKAQIFVNNLVNSDNSVKASSEKDYNTNLSIGNNPDYNNRGFNGYIQSIEIYNDVIEYSSVAETITLNKYTDSIPAGQADTLTATVTPDSTTNKNVTWTSSDPTIVSVDDNGKITAKGKGTATIKATTTDGTNLSKSCVVTVTEQVTPIPTPTTGNRATLTINMVNGSLKQYDLSEDELNNFLNWYNGMTNPLSAQCYTFNNPITGPYLNNKDYIPFNKIDDFKVQEYTK